VKPHSTDVEIVVINGQINFIYSQIYKMSHLRVLSRWRNAVNFFKPGQVSKIYAKNFILVPTFDNVIITDKKKLENYFKKAKEKNVYVFFESDKYVFGDCGFNVSGFYNFLLEGKGHRARFIFSIVEEEGDYKISTHHSTKI